MVRGGYESIINDTNKIKNDAFIDLIKLIKNILDITKNSGLNKFIELL